MPQTERNPKQTLGQLHTQIANTLNAMQGHASALTKAHNELALRGSQEIEELKARCSALEARVGAHEDRLAAIEAELAEARARR